MLKELTQSDKVYLRVVGGNFVQKVKEGTEEAVGAAVRKWKAPDGTEGETLERTYMEWEGMIRNVSLKDNDYGEVCIIEGDDVIITLPTNSRYFTDFASKVFNIKLDHPVNLHPYDFEAEGKKRTGISIKQHNTKVTNFFYDGKDNCNGFPIIDEARKDKNGYWTIYFAEVTMFLTDKLGELKFFEPAIEKEEEGEKQEGKETYRSPALGEGIVAVANALVTREQVKAGDAEGFGKMINSPAEPPKFNNPKK